VGTDYVLSGLAALVIRRERHAFTDEIECFFSFLRLKLSGVVLSRWQLPRAGQS
jgi:hypothetical protein